jgi:hypothetical protein
MADWEAAQAAACQYSLTRARAGLLPFAFPGDSFNSMRHKEVMS